MKATKFHARVAENEIPKVGNEYKVTRVLPMLGVKSSFYEIPELSREFFYDECLFSKLSGIDEPELVTELEESLS